MKKSALRFFFAVLALFLFGEGAFAQNQVYAITNAKVFTVAGATIEKGNVVIRDGLIEAVGADAKIPADAIAIDGSGLNIYPGFFDAQTSLGLAGAPTPARTPGERGAAAAQAQQQPQTNSNYPNGMQPETSALDQLKSGEAQFESARNLGFTSALVVGRDGIFNGESALINLAGDSISAMVIRAPVAMHVSFKTLPGVYPASLLGTFSALRQMFLDAKRLDQIKKMYEANPRGMKRPDADKSLEALIPVVNGTMSVVFNANSEREIIRAIDLAKEFNLRAMIAGGQEAWKVADRLKAANIPVLLSLNFPKRTAAASTEADPESLEILRARADAPKNAARLKAAGVRFAFQSGAMQNLSDFFANAGKAIENGLAKDDALRAMTLSTAEIFGVADRLGSIEQGKIANLVVTRGDLFAKDKSITHVFVDGKLFEQKPAPKTEEKKPANGGPKNSDANSYAAAANLSGIWNVTVEIPGQALPVTMSLSQQAEKLSGNLSSAFFPSAEIRTGSVTGDNFRIELTVNVDGQSLEVTFSGTVNGNSISGSGTTPMGIVPFSGTRQP